MNLKDIFKNLSDFFDGKKTYIFLIALALFGFADIKDFIPQELIQYKPEIYIGLLTGAGISLRMGVQKATNK